MALVSLWLFTLLMAAPWIGRGVSSRVSLDGWGSTVLRRSVTATQILWGVLTLGHVVFWCIEYGLHPGALAPVLLLGATSTLHRERSLWCALAGGLVLVGVLEPRSFALSAGLTALILGLRCLRSPLPRVLTSNDRSSDSPYRGVPEDIPPSSTRLAPAPVAARNRLLAGAIIALFLASWTWGWSGGAWPAHVVLLDLAVAGALFAFMRWTGARSPVAPLVLLYGHLAVELGWLGVPQSTLAWGMSSVALGFGLLLVSLSLSWWLARAPDDPTT